MKNTMVPRAPVIVWNWSLHCPSLSAMFDSLHSSMNQEVFKKYLCHKSSHNDYVKEAIICNHQINIFTFNKDE